LDGFPQQVEIFDAVADRLGKAPPVLDSNDILVFRPIYKIPILPIDLTAACERSKPAFCTGAELEGLVAGGDIAQKFAASARIVPAYNGWASSTRRWQPLRCSKR
jgi:hypothetical protein